ncbi:hypothetical protein FOA52_005422 [Chlamydomonas sp. UWO 241]|nr:hypothetical protein FOA52_005422 [Chlamydomonas sp. UWO 241]
MRQAALDAAAPQEQGRPTSFMGNVLSAVRGAVGLDVARAREAEMATDMARVPKAWSLPPGGR